MQRSDEVTLMNWVGRFFETQCMSRITDEVVPLKTKLQGGGVNYETLCGSVGTESELGIFVVV